MVKYASSKLLILIAFVFLIGCDKSEDNNNNSQDKIYGINAKGIIPSSLDAKMLLGLQEDPGSNWMANSGVDWNSRYIYLSAGWVDNWGWSERNGSIAFNYMKESDAINAIPVLEYYVLNNIGVGTHNELYQKTTDAALMMEYFDQFKILLTRAKEFGKPVIILIEADGLAFLEIQSDNNPLAYSAIADSKLDELSALPNTLTGWGLAFLELKNKVGATNVSLGMHVSAWASNVDLAYSASHVPLQPEVDKVYNFLSPLGLIANQTGITYDFLVGDPLDRDADFYMVNYDTDRWWSMESTASVNSSSFNRYAEWLKLWNEKTKKRWILWQIPLGNKFHLNVDNNGNAREGYKDNRVEYFLEDTSLDNMAKFADCGVVGLLYGAGASFQATNINDYDENGNLYMKSKASIFYSRGGMNLMR
jgi:hypothetical protein